MDYSLAPSILVVPLATFLVLGLLNNKVSPGIAGIMGTLGTFVITALSYYTAYVYFTSPNSTGAFVPVEALNFPWLFFTNHLQIHIGVLLDSLSVMMLVVITSISLMVHIYSLGYMAGESGFQRYYSFLSLFTFSMLGLVLATNIFQLYIFWELVGVSSYLLIGFYYERPAAVAAAKKAFIVTRFADFGFLVGILILSFSANTFDFNLLTSLHGPAVAAPACTVFLGVSITTWALLLVFMGGAGKSAMFPLHIWLPDAMEGPTPVSALIHAATMVVAGVFLIARLFPIYSFTAPEALDVIAYVGSFTSLFAAIIACTQIDIKRVLAYSTLSQIGYMMVALGVSGYGGEAGLGYMASLFHLFTHAFFKALLFLGAGSVIHAVHSNLLTEMGGLRKRMPITHITFLIACLAIAGIPPFSGFFSKDEILIAAFEHNRLIFSIQWIVSGITAFYMFRLYFSIFWSHSTEHQHPLHESPKTMTIPLIILAVASALAGFVPFSQLVTSDGRPFQTEVDWQIAFASVLIAFAGIGSAAFLYQKQNSKPQIISGKLSGVYSVTFHKFYIDETYLFITRRFFFHLVAQPIVWFDKHVVDGAVNLVANGTLFFSAMIKKMQSGHMQEYIWYFASGVLMLALIVLYFN